MILGSQVRIHLELFPNVHFEYVFLDLAKVWSGCQLCSLVVWNPDSPQIAALNLVLKSSNMRQNQKTTFSVKLTRIPWMFDKIFYFFKKYKWSPLFNLKKSFDPLPFDLRQSIWSPPIFRSPPPGKKWHFPKIASYIVLGRQQPLWHLWWLLKKPFCLIFEKCMCIYG